MIMTDNQVIDERRALQYEQAKIHARRRSISTNLSLVPASKLNEILSSTVSAKSKWKSKSLKNSTVSNNNRTPNRRGSNLATFQETINDHIQHRRKSNAAIEQLEKQDQLANFVTQALRQKREKLREQGSISTNLTRYETKSHWKQLAHKTLNKGSKTIFETISSVESVGLKDKAHVTNRVNGKKDREKSEFIMDLRNSVLLTQPEKDVSFHTTTEGSVASKKKESDTSLEFNNELTDESLNPEEEQENCQPMQNPLRLNNNIYEKNNISLLDRTKIPKEQLQTDTKSKSISNKTDKNIRNVKNIITRPENFLNTENTCVACSQTTSTEVFSPNSVNVNITTKSKMESQNQNNTYSQPLPRISDRFLENVPRASHFASGFSKTPNQNSNRPNKVNSSSPIGIEMIKLSDVAERNTDNSSDISSNRNLNPNRKGQALLNGIAVNKNNNITENNNDNSNNSGGLLNTQRSIKFADTDELVAFIPQYNYILPVEPVHPRIWKRYKEELFIERLLPYCYEIKCIVLSLVCVGIVIGIYYLASIALDLHVATDSGRAYHKHEHG